MKIDNMDNLIKEIKNIREDLPEFSPEQIRDILWDEAKFHRKEDHRTSYILRLGKIQLLEIVSKNM